MSQSNINRTSQQANLSGPLIQTLGFTKGGQVHGLACIALLFWKSRPFNITRFIMAFIFNAVNRMFGCRPASNFGKKLFKRFKTKFNTFCSIIHVSTIIRIIATGLGVHISPIFRRANFADGFSVRGRTGNELFSAPTPARTVITAQQIFTYDGYRVATITKTMPRNALFSTSCNAEHKQSVKAATSQNNHSGMYPVRRWVYGKIISSQDVFSYLENIAVRVVRSYNFFRPAFIIS